MMEKDAFLIKQRHQCRLSQWVEWLYGAQSWKEKRLLCESMPILIKKELWFQKNGGKKCYYF